MFQSLNALVAATLLLSNGLGGLASPAIRRQVGGETVHAIASFSKCVDVRGAKLENGTPVQIFDCNHTGAQNWQLTRGTTGHIQLAGTSFCLDAGSKPANGVGMKIWTCFDNLPAQQWTYGDNNSIKLANTNFCLDLTEGTLANSNQLQTWQCTGGKNQLWSEGQPGTTTSPTTPTATCPALPPPTTCQCPTTTSRAGTSTATTSRTATMTGSTTTGSTITDSTTTGSTTTGSTVTDSTSTAATTTATVSTTTAATSPTTPVPAPTGRSLHPSKNANKCMDVKGAVFANGTPVQIFDCNDTNAQRWTFTRGATKVQVTGTNFCLDSTTANPANGVGLKIWQCFDGLAAQTWNITTNHQIKLQSANSCVDLTNGVTTNSNRLQVWACSTGNTNQIWSA